MNERRYLVFIDDEIIARGMDLKTATILITAFFEEYYNDHSMVISIKEEERIVGVEESLYKKGE